MRSPLFFYGSFLLLVLLTAGSVPQRSFRLLDIGELPAGSHPGGSRDYYFSHDGNDNADGSREHPFATIKKCNTLQLQPGDSVFFRGGVRFDGRLTLTGGGSPGRLTVVTSYGKGKAIIASGDSSAILLEKGEYLSLENFICVGSGRKKGNTRPGVSVADSRYIQVSGFEVSGFQKAGLLVSRSEHVVVRSVFAHDNGAAGIEVSGEGDKSACRDITIEGCQAENNPGDPSNLVNHSGNGIVAGYCRAVSIRYCSASNNGWDMPRKGNGPVGIWCFESDSVVIEHCISFRNKTSVGGGDGGGFDFDGGVTRSVMQYNLSYENQGAGYCLFQYAGASPWHDNLVRYNISENDGQVSEAGGSVFIWNSSGDASQFYNAAFYNNTIVNQRKPVLSYSEFGKRKGFFFSNNIFISAAGAIMGSAGKDEFSGNDWWSLSKIRPSVPGMNVRPGFVIPASHKPEIAVYLSAFTGYSLPGSSPLFSGGVQVRDFFGFGSAAFDYNGNKPPDRGIGAAFEKR